MDELKNERCPVCGELFSLSGYKDTVYCPDCGRPVHAACWQGGCPDEALHGTGYQWHSEAEAEVASAPAPRERTESTYTVETMYDRPEYINPDELYARLAEEYSKENEALDEKAFMGVSARELYHYTNAENGHMLRFQIMLYMAKTGKKVRFGLLSGLLAPYAQFYMGLTALGLLILLVQTVFSLPDIVYYFAMLFPSDSMTQLVNSGGFMSAYGITSYLSFGLTVLMCLFGDYLQLLHAVKQIKILREMCSEMPRREYYRCLEEKGSYKGLRLVVGIVLQFVLIGAVVLIFRNVYSA